MKAKTLTLKLISYTGARFSETNRTIPEFVHDPRFHVHGVGVRYANGAKVLRPDVLACLQGLQKGYGANLQQAIVVFHGAHLQLYILAKKYGIRPARFLDVSALSNAVYGRRGEGGASGSLKFVAERLGLEPKGDISFMEGIRSPDPMQFTALSDYARHDVELTYQACVRLLPMIANPAVELPIMQHTVRLFTERGLCVDRESLQELIAEREASVAAKLNQLGLRREDVTRDMLFTEHLGVALQATDRSVPRKWSGKQGARIPAIAKTDREMQALLQDPDERVRLLAQMRLEQKSSDSTLPRLYKLQRIANATGGTLPVHLVYNGAHTGRFSGGGGFNLQNLPGSDVGVRIRGVLRPKPGHMFVIADYRQIETRVLARITGENDLLDALREGRDIYAEFASNVFGKEVREANAEDSAEVADEMTAMRNVGKKAMLGLGFGMGSRQFYEELRADPRVNLLFADGRLTAASVKKIVSRYRDSYRGIRNAWSILTDEIDKQANDAVQMSGVSMYPHSTGVTVKLPLLSRRTLRYENVRKSDPIGEVPYMDDKGEVAYFTPKKAVWTYGADKALHGRVLTENIAQATARDILVEAILALEAEGLPVVLHIHDEVVVEVPEDRAEEALHRVRGIMCRTPQWLEGCPLAVEARIADRFGK